MSAPRLRRTTLDRDRHGIVGKLLATKRRPDGTAWLVPHCTVASNGPSLRGVVCFRARMPILTENPSALIKRAKPWRDTGDDWQKIGCVWHDRKLFLVVLAHYPDARFAMCRSQKGVVGPQVGAFGTAWVDDKLVAVLAPVAGRPAYTEAGKR